MSDAMVPAKPATTAVATDSRKFARPMLNREALIEEGNQRALLMEYVSAHMVEGTDFGVIPGTEGKKADGTPKPKVKSLLKPGAEKLVDLFQCSAEFDIIERIEDFDKPLFYYVFQCRIISREHGHKVAEGFGSASTHEKKYRYISAERKCPECGKATVFKSKEPPRNAPQGTLPGYYCWAKKDGCGAQFAANDDRIVGQPSSKIDNPDAADYANTVLKMAKKRALVDAAIQLARCSNMFTQDVEDMHGQQDNYREERPNRSQQTPPQANVAADDNDNYDPHDDEIDAVLASNEAFASAWNESKVTIVKIVREVFLKFAANHSVSDKISGYPMEQQRYVARILLIDAARIRGE